MTAPLTLTVVDRAATLTLTRPELMNRFDGELHTEFGRALEEPAVTGARAAEVVDVAFSYEQRSALSEDLVEAVHAARERRVGEYRGR